jgi:hypothetical protein
MEMKERIDTWEDGEELSDVVLLDDLALAQVDALEASVEAPQPLQGHTRTHAQSLSFRGVSCVLIRHLMTAKERTK